MKMFESGTIGNLQLKNRIVMDAINCQMAGTGPEPGLAERAIDFYVARAKGGAGLIKTTFMRPNHKFEFSIGEPVVASERAVYWLNNLAEAVHDYEAKICVQLSPGLGRIPAALPNVPDGGLIGPSPLPSWRDPQGQPPRLGLGRYPAIAEKHIITRELTVAEIKEIVRDYENSCRIIALADIDAIEIHAHMGYLVDEFLTPIWNKRNDEYGGDLNGRMKFLLEIVQAAKRGAGENFPLLIKYPTTHYLEGGRELEEGIEIGRRLAAAGVHAITVNAGTYETYDRAQPPTTAGPGCAVDVAEAVKKALKIPVIVVGKLGYPDFAERVLQEGKADFISLARQFLADPEWPNKVKEGRIEDIRPCTYCNEACVGRVRKYQHISCAVNPAAGAERELEIRPAEKKKSVLVVGGGPAGMEAARVAALRGHKVTIWEKDQELGGQLILAAIPAFKHDYKLLLLHLRAQIKKLDIKVEFGKEATPELIRATKPDVLFLATGARCTYIEIEGMQEGIKDGKVKTAEEVLLEKAKPKRKVVIIGGGPIGCETGLYLAQQGSKVTIIKGRPMETLAGDINWINALHLFKILHEHEVEILDEHRTLRITQAGVDVQGKNGATKALDADLVVVACGMESNDACSMKPNDGTFEPLLKDKIPQVFSIGDCVEPRRVMDAIWEGYRKARII